VKPFAAVVDRVIDGDTIWMRVRIRTRASAPSAGTAEGKAETEALKKLYPRGQKVWIEPITTDQFGRVIATIAASPLGGSM
jgi:endonuclease YncB( thermonuclease family)